MNRTWQRYLDLAGGLGHITQRGAETVVKTLVKQGEMAADLAEKAVDDLLARSEANRQAVRSMVEAEIERTIARLGLVRQEEVAGLQARMEQLEAQQAAAASRAEAVATADPTTSVKKSGGAQRRSPAKKPSTGTRSGGARGTTTTRKKKDAGNAAATKTARPVADTPPQN